mmetsp:Transcript_26170/g.56761  ORF Transcript_26170/g.56761 Transcript_26170/m.56761 type:complete len:815 (+) Transcript_26170:79-2523(+)
MSNFAQRFANRRSVAQADDGEESDEASKTASRRGSSQRPGLDTDEEAEHLGALRRRLRKSAGGGRDSSFDQRVRNVRDRIRSMMVGDGESSDDAASARSQTRRSRSSAFTSQIDVPAEPEPAQEEELTGAVSVASAPTAMTSNSPATSRRASRRAERLSTASEYYIGVVDADSEVVAPMGAFHTPADETERPPQRASRSPSASLFPATRVPIPAPVVDSWCRGPSPRQSRPVVGLDCDALEGSRVTVIDESSCHALSLPPTGTIIEVRCEGQRVRVEHDGDEQAQRYYNTGRGGEHQLFLLDPSPAAASVSAQTSRRPSAISALSVSAMSGNSAVSNMSANIGSNFHLNSNFYGDLGDQEPASTSADLVTETGAGEEQQMGRRASRRSLRMQAAASDADANHPQDATAEASQDAPVVESAFAERRRRRSARLSSGQVEEVADAALERESQLASQAAKQPRGSTASRQSVSQPLVPRRRSVRPPPDDVSAAPTASRTPSQPAKSGRQSPMPSTGSTLEVPQEAIATGSSNSTSLLRRYSKRSTTSRSTEGTLPRKGSRPPSPNITEEAVSSAAEAKPPAKVRLSKASRASCSSVASPAPSDTAEAARVGRRASKAPGTKKGAAAPQQPPPLPPPPASLQSSAYEGVSSIRSTSATQLQQPLPASPQSLGSPEPADSCQQRGEGDLNEAWTASTSSSKTSSETPPALLHQNLSNESLISLEARFTERLVAFREELAREMVQLEERAVKRALSEVEQRLQKEAAALSAKVLALSHSCKVKRPRTFSPTSIQPLFFRFRPHLVLTKSQSRIGLRLGDG